VKTWGVFWYTELLQRCRCNQGDTTWSPEIDPCVPQKWGCRASCKLHAFVTLTRPALVAMARCRFSCECSVWDIITVLSSQHYILAITITCIEDKTIRSVSNNYTCRILLDKLRLFGISTLRPTFGTKAAQLSREWKYIIRTPHQIVLRTMR
jgi:hypothetical protein